MKIAINWSNQFFPEGPEEKGLKYIYLRPFYIYMYIHKPYSDG